MIKQDVALYTYRLFSTGGHTFIALAEFDNVMDFLDEIKDLRERSRSFESCYISTDNRIIPLSVDPQHIVAIDAPLDRPPITLQAHKDNLRAHKFVRQNKKKETRKVAPGQTVSRRR